MSAEIVRSATTKEGSRFEFDWQPYRYDFSGPWTGATEYVLYAEREVTSVHAWAGQYRLDPALLAYPVDVESFVPELGVYLIRAQCLVGRCIAMEGRRLGWDGPVALGDLDHQEDWPVFQITTAAIIFAVGDCQRAHALADRMDVLLQQQGARPGPEPLREPCPDALQLARLP